MSRRPRGSWPRFGSSCLALALAASACTEPAPESEIVDAHAGPVQPVGDGLVLLDADEACDRLFTLLSERADAIGGCEVSLACPQGIFPAGGCEVWEYDASTIEACEAEIAGYERCTDLVERACVVTAVPTGALCTEPSGGGGEAGAGATGLGGND